MAIEQTLEGSKMSSHILTAMKLLFDRDKTACQPLVDHLIETWYIKSHYGTGYQRMHTCTSKEVFYNYRTGRFTTTGNFGSTIYIGELNINRMKGRAIIDAECDGTSDAIGEVLLTKLADSVNKRRAELIAAHDVGATLTERRAIKPKHEWSRWLGDVTGSYAPENLLDRDVLEFLVKAAAQRLDIHADTRGPLETHVLRILDGSGRVDKFLDFFKSVNTGRFLAATSERYGNDVTNHARLLYRILGRVRGANALIEAFEERYTDTMVKSMITRESIEQLVYTIKGGAELTVGERELKILEEMVSELADSNAGNAFENIKALSAVLSENGAVTKTLIRSVDYTIGLRNRIDELVSTPNLRPLVLGFKKAPATDSNFKTSIFFDRMEFINLILSDVEHKAIWTNISRDRLLFELEHSVITMAPDDLEKVQDYFNRVTVLGLTQRDMIYLVNEKDFELNYTKFFSDIFDWEGAPTL